MMSLCQIERCSFFHHTWHDSCCTEFRSNDPPGSLGVSIVFDLPDRIAREEDRIRMRTEKSPRRSGGQLPGRGGDLGRKNLALEDHILDKECGKATVVVDLAPGGSHDVVNAALGVLAIPNASPLGCGVRQSWGCENAPLYGFDGNVKHSFVFL